jgi:hypothetical protein
MVQDACLLLKNWSNIRLWELFPANLADFKKSQIKRQLKTTD